MAYKVNVDRIAIDVNDEVKNAILTFISTYDFRYVTSMSNKATVRELFKEHFEQRRSLDSLTQQLLSRGGSHSLARTETNRIHTAALGNLLSSKGIMQCTTVHSYGEDHKMAAACIRNLEARTLDIKEVLKNTFPEKIEDLNRADLPMIPQHPNCRHVMAPIE